MSKKNRWLDDDFDDGFSSSRAADRWGNDDAEDFDPDKDYLTQAVERKQNNMLESTYRSLQMLDESEKVGAATGEELVRQGEVLRQTERRVDKMEQDLKESDRHLRSIKSLWGAFRNKFSKEPPKATFEESDGNSSTRSKLNDALKQCDAIEEEALDERSDSLSDRVRASRDMSSGTSQGKPQASHMQQVDKNLDLMGQSLARLKNLGIGLQEELDSQDPVIERLHGKVEKVDTKIYSTNKEMIKLNHR